MNKKQLSTGEIAKISGLTIRTLQHYDNIGILPASGRTDGGRRFYTEDDIIKLEHILFYKGLGFSLEEIKEKLLKIDIDKNTSNLLSNQKIMLFNQIYSIQNSIAAIEASEEIISVGKTPPWALLTTLMKSLGNVDISYWADYDFTDNQKKIFDEQFQTFDNVMDFYNTWKRLSIKAAAFLEAGVEPDEDIAQNLAYEWDRMVQNVTTENLEHDQAFFDVYENRNSWDNAEKELFEKAEIFLEKIIEIYYKKL